MHAEGKNAHNRKLVQNLTRTHTHTITLTHLENRELIKQIVKNFTPRLWDKYLWACTGLHVCVCVGVS